MKLVRFRSSAGDALTSLADYVKRMPESQKTIYFVPADSPAAAASSPHAEALRKRGYEVIYAVDPVEEWVLQGDLEFEGKRFASALAGSLDLPEDAADKEAREKKSGALSGLVGAMKTSLAAHVKDVRVTDRLTESPACLVHESWETSPRLERLLKAQDRSFEGQKRVLEVNPDHPFVARLNELAADPASAGRVEELSQLLYDQALVAEGSAPSDPARFARQVAKLLADAAAK